MNMTPVALAAVAFLALAAAKAEGKPAADETAQWQRAIDAAAAHGGGRVTIPAGRHLVGQLDLRSNVEIHLAEGAVLEGLPGLEHYRIVELPFSEGTWSAILFAQNVTNVAITGKGEIFGNGMAWKVPERFGNNQEGLRARGFSSPTRRASGLRTSPCGTRRVGASSSSAARASWRAV